MRLAFRDGRSLQFAVEENGVRVRLDAPGLPALSLVVPPEKFAEVEQGLSDAIDEHQARGER